MANRTESKGYLGYRSSDFDTPYAKYFDQTMSPLAPHVVEAVNLGAQAPALFDNFASCASLAGDGYALVETGYAIATDGSMRVSVLTEMPGVTPAMWDWWFGWHGSDSRRYKLWHPRAHLRAEWDDGDDRGRRGKQRYVGRTSRIDEYLGSTLALGCIQFKPASEFGFTPAGDDSTFICARVGVRVAPVDIGYLVHQVRLVEGGAEMRSRFWLGGHHIAARVTTPGVAQVLPRVAARMFSVTSASASELLVHCAQEMRHLADRLPALYVEFGQE